LREAKSGVSFADDYAKLGFRCQVHGAPTLDPSAIVDRRAMRFHGGGTAWNHVAMDQAIRDASTQFGQSMLGISTSVSQSPVGRSVWAKSPSANTGAMGGVWIAAETDQGPRSLSRVVTTGSAGSCAAIRASATR
jgi:3-oxoacyl-(acyl-carrier-protein) synthase